MGLYIYSKIKENELIQIGTSGTDLFRDFIEFYTRKAGSAKVNYLHYLCF